jgi:thiamine-phosphate diphosphorylase
VKIGGLYVLIDPAACKGRNPIDVAYAALEGGASMLQWRDKQRDKGEQLDDLHAIYNLCIEHDAALIINDHADLALVLAGEDAPEHGGIGIHVGQKDLPLAEVVRIVPHHYIVGVSTNNADEASKAAGSGAAYVAVGDIYGTASKTGTRPASIDRLVEVRSAVQIPVIGIGGINASNASQVMQAGANGIAVISAVCSADDPKAAAEELVKIVNQ